MGKAIAEAIAGGASGDLGSASGVGLGAHQKLGLVRGRTETLVIYA
ncbi:hypothetical protein [Phormidium sp. CCY1219]|nr:hypothetical protein [Phormidium sp. CCY1219]MEB3829513.1 hypothetical protein [Phormidium sp. CCY1219]